MLREMALQLLMVVTASDAADFVQWHRQAAYHSDCGCDHGKDWADCGGWEYGLDVQECLGSLAANAMIACYKEPQK